MKCVHFKQKMIICGVIANDNSIEKEKNCKPVFEGSSERGSNDKNQNGLEKESQTQAENEFNN